MKKAFFTCIALLVTVLFAASGMAAQNDAVSSATMSVAPARAESNKIILNMNGTAVHAVLYDNAAARSFRGLLPYTVTVFRAPDDLCGSVSENLAVNPAEDQSTWAVGEIGWFDGWFTILCGNEAGMPKRTRTIIGKLAAEDLPFVQSLTGSVQITVTLEQ